MAQWAIIPDGNLVAQVDTVDPAGRYYPTWHCVPCSADVRAGWVWDGGTGFAAPPSPTAPSGPHYVPLSTIRDRVTAAGKWTVFAAALDSLSSDKRWHLLTLTEGVASDDPDATALLTAVGCDPAEILA